MNPGSPDRDIDFRNRFVFVPSGVTSVTRVAHKVIILNVLVAR